MSWGMRGWLLFIRDGLWSNLATFALTYTAALRDEDEAGTVPVNSDGGP